MIPYNVSESQLILPEYGRNIQRMIDHCVAIEQREERTRCAYAVCDAIARLFPGIIGEGENRQKIWDHMNIMSGFKLDIDFPCEVVTEAQLNPKPEKIPYNETISRYRNYGKNIQMMIHQVGDMENCVKKDQLIFLVANQMKKLLLVNNPESATDARVFDDIANISGGKILIDPTTYRLNEYIDSTPVKGKKKKNHR